MISNPQKAHLEPQRMRRWILGSSAAFALLTVVALLSAIHMYAGQIVIGKPILWSLACRRSMEDWYSSLVLLVPAFFLARGRPLKRGSAGSWFAVHFTCSIVLSFGYIAVFSQVLDGQTSIEGTVFRFLEVFKKLVLHYLPATIISYWLVVVGHNGWLYYRGFQERELLATELERELVRARLETLRMQLNPHFLFNTLHTISALVHQNPAAADRTIARLSDLLRVTLSPSEQQEVRLEQEFEFLRSYLDIEQTRFADRLTLDLALEPGLEKALVPPLILQPLAENAVRHGIEPLDSGGRVSVRAMREGDHLVLRVVDNGPGIGVAQARVERAGVGLANTRSRLQHLYGTEHRFEIANLPEGGLEVSLRIPLRFSAEASAPNP